MLSEEALIKNCKKGDQIAQKQLYESFAGLVMHIVKRYSNNQEEAKDLFQEAFVNIYSSMAKTKTIDSLQNWIYTISVRTAIAQLRNKKKSLFNQLDDNVDNQRFSKDDFNVFDKIQHDELMAFVQNLPDGYRVIFNLYLVEGYSHKEIGKLLKISETTSRSQLSRCKGIIRKHLQHLRTTGYEKTL